MIDSYQAIYLSFKYAYENMGLPPLPYEVAKKVVGRGLGHTFQELLGAQRTPRALSLFREKYEEVFRTHTHVLPDVPEVLEALHRRGFQMAVATNKLGRFSRAIIEHLGMAKFFSVIVGDGDVSQNKPFPEMLYYALGKMGLSKGDAVFVGDSLIDIQTANNAGLKVLAVSTGNTAREDLEKARPTVLLNRLPDLLAYVS